MNKSYFDGLNKKLFDSIPNSSKRILELGCANGRLGSTYKHLNEGVHWTGVDNSSTALEKAKDVLDHVIQVDLNRESLLSIFEKKHFDTIVIGDLLEQIVKPDKLLDELFELTTDTGKIVCCLPNMSHLSVVQKIITGDITYDEMGLLDKTHLRLYSPASAFKLFLDSQWLPNLKDQYRTNLQESQFLRGILHASNSLGVPTKTALKNLGLYQMIIECTKSIDIISQQPIKMSLSVVVPVTRQWELNENIMKSPGLKEINAEIIPISNAKTAHEAYEEGRKRAKNDWILFAHQDLYLPQGAGNLIISNLSALGLFESPPPIGFAGIDAGFKKAGLLIDRTALFSYPSSNHAISIDECAVLLHRNSRVKIDSNLGWHTWATDLCLQAAIKEDIENARILRIPLFHNSLNDYSLPDAYHSSARTLKEKYPEFNRIETLCGAIV